MASLDPKTKAQQATEWLHKIGVVCPESGAHAKLYAAVLRLLQYSQTDEAIHEAIAEWMPAEVRARRPGDELRREVDEAITSGKRELRLTPAELEIVEREPKWPAYSEKAIRQVLAEQPTTLAELAALSPAQFDESDLTDGGRKELITETLKVLFPEWEARPVALAVKRWSAQKNQVVIPTWMNHLEDLVAADPFPLGFPGLEACEFCVPSHAFVWRKKGRPCWDSESNKRDRYSVRDRGYMVLEIDPVDDLEDPRRLYKSRDAQATLIAHMARIVPIAAVVWSGGKSLQAWVRADMLSEAELNAVMRYARSLGCDEAGFRKTQLFRLPWGKRTRLNERGEELPGEPVIQPVVYLHPGRVQGVELPQSDDENGWCFAPRLDRLPKKFQPTDEDRTNIVSLEEMIARVPEGRPIQVLDTDIPAADPILFDAASSAYFRPDRSGAWFKVGEGNIQLHLRRCGYSHARAKDQPLSAIEKELLTAQDERRLDYAGRLAGYKSGLYILGGKRVLVTDSYRCPEPVEGVDWPYLREFLAGIFEDEAEHFFLGWLRFAYKAFRSGSPEDHRPGQMVCLVGPSGCGKSLLQWIITETLGGTCAKPYRYLSGLTPFNADLAGANHLAIEDESARIDNSARSQLGTRLKDFVVNEWQSIHPKGRDAVTLPLCWRISLSTNDDGAEHLLVLPEIQDPSVRDKLLMLQCQDSPVPQVDCVDPDNEGAMRARRREIIRAELPGFVHWLLNTMALPASMESRRYGVQSFIDGKVETALKELSREAAIADALRSIFANSEETAPQTANEIARLLVEHFPMLRDHFRGTAVGAGIVLARVSKAFPQLLTCRHTRHGNLWTVSTGSEK